MLNLLLLLLLRVDELNLVKWQALSNFAKQKVLGALVGCLKSTAQPETPEMIKSNLADILAD